MKILRLVAIVPLVLLSASSFAQGRQNREVARGSSGGGSYSARSGGRYDNSGGRYENSGRRYSGSRYSYSYAAPYAYYPRSRSYAPRSYGYVYDDYGYYDYGYNDYAYRGYDDYYPPVSYRSYRAAPSFRLGIVLGGRGGRDRGRYEASRSRRR